MILKAVMLLTAAALGLAGFNSVPKHNTKPCRPHNCPTTSTTGTTSTTPSTTTSPTTTTQPTTTTTPPPPTCTSTLAAGGDVVSFFNGLSPGDTGCIHAGVYGPGPDLIGGWNHLTASGTSSAPITLQSYPGETATIRGYTAVDGSYNVFTHLNFDIANSGAGGSGCTIHATGIDLAGTNNVLDHLNIAPSLSAYARSAVQILNSSNTLRYSKVHGWGGSGTACEAHDHGVYDNSGSGAQIHHNWFYDSTPSSGWCVQMYPSESNAHVYSNICDHNGSGFVNCSTGSNNLIENNVVSNSTGTSQVPGSLVDGCGPQGSSGHVIRDNDQFNNPGGFGPCLTGETCSGNINVDPQYVNATAHDYRTQNSALVSYGLWDGS